MRGSKRLCVCRVAAQPAYSCTRKRSCWHCERGAAERRGSLEYAGKQVGVSNARATYTIKLLTCGLAEVEDKEAAPFEAERKMAVLLDDDGAVHVAALALLPSFARDLVTRSLGGTADSLPLKFASLRRSSCGSADVSWLSLTQGGVGPSRSGCAYLEDRARG